MKTKLFFSSSTINNNFRFLYTSNIEIYRAWTMNSYTVHDQSYNEETIIPSEMSYNSLHFCQRYKLLVNKTDLLTPQSTKLELLTFVAVIKRFIQILRFPGMKKIDTQETSLSPTS